MVLLPKDPFGQAEAPAAASRVDLNGSVELSSYPGPKLGIDEGQGDDPVRAKIEMRGSGVPRVQGNGRRDPQGIGFRIDEHLHPPAGLVDEFSNGRICIWRSHCLHRRGEGDGRTWGWGSLPRAASLVRKRSLTRARRPDGHKSKEHYGGADAHSLCPYTLHYELRLVWSRWRRVT